MSKKINYVLFDGVYHQKLKPLTLTRPVADLRVGIFKIHEKWEHLLGEKVGIRTKDYLGKSYNSFNDNAGVGISGALIPNPELCDAINTLKEKTIMMKEGKVFK